MRKILLAAVGVSLSIFGMNPPARAAADPAGANPGVFWVIPHTHWEGAVFKTREEYLEMGLVNIVRAVRLLESHPGYRFTLDQASYVRPFLERYPEEEAAFRRFIDEGRLAIVGGTDVMCDVNIPGGESFIRQVLYGKGYFRRKLGVDVTVGWQLDTFGHHAQMPQLLALAGYRSFWFFRGVPKWETPSELAWEGIDGTRIPAYWLPHAYGLAYGSPDKLPEFTRFMVDRYKSLDVQSKGPDRVGLAGVDVSAPEDHLPGLVEELGRQAGRPLDLRLATPLEFEKAVEGRGERPVLKAELNPIFQGVYSSRIELKQTVREMEALLGAAEALGAIARWRGSPADPAAIWRAWEPVLFNQTHDLSSGVMTDHVYEDTVSSYRFSRRLGEELVADSLAAVSAGIDTSGEGIPVVVWNLLGWPRSDLAEAEVSISESGAKTLRVLDPAGRPVPVQVREVQRSDSGIILAGVSFLARDVPALGYAVYRVIPDRSALAEAPGAPPVAAAADGTMENDLYRVKIDPPTGAMTSLVLKPGGWEALAGQANVITREKDGGDFWELYQPLDGGSRIAMTRKQPLPRPGTAALSSEFPGTSSAASGPVFAEFTAARKMGPETAVVTRVRLYAGLPRIEVQTRLTNQARYVRYQALFPTSIHGGRVVHEIPFGAIERPNSIEFPAQTWADYGDGQRGLAILNRGLPGNLVIDDTMVVSLARATSITNYGFGGGYEPGMSSDSGLELGKELVLNYALLPHDGDWREAAAFRRGLEFNRPLVVRKAPAHPGSLPRTWGLAEISHPAVVLSALKPGPDGSIVLRIYEAAGRPAPGVKVQLHAEVSGVEETGLMEDPGKKLEVTGDTFGCDLRAFEIKTFRIQPK